MNNFWTANALALIVIFLFLTVILLMYIANQIPKKTRR